jgi:hypothetical protein
MAHSALWPSASGSPPRRAARSSNVKATRDDWLDLALSVLALEGVDHVTVLYLSDRWDELNTRSIVAQAEAPATTVNEAVCNVFRCWINPTIFSPRLDFAVREWARRSAHVRKALDRSDRVRTEAMKALFVRFGYEDGDAFVRARVLYYMQIGYYALDLREPIETRLHLTPHYLKAFTGVDPDQVEIDAFRAYALSHAHLPDFEPSRGRS